MSNQIMTHAIKEPMTEHPICGKLDDERNKEAHNSHRIWMKVIIYLENNLIWLILTNQSCMYFLS